MTALSAVAAPTAGIAFLDKGEVWVLSPAGRGEPQQQTRTGATVEDFRFSPRGDYLAYAKRLRPGRGRPICSIVIVNVATGGVITEIQPDEGWIQPPATSVTLASACGHAASAAIAPRTITMTITPHAAA